MRLNGWQRLWVVGSALWIVTVAGWARHEHHQIAERHLAQLERELNVDRQMLRVAQSVQQPPDVQARLELLELDIDERSEQLRALRERPVTPAIKQEQREMVTRAVGAALLVPALAYGAGLVVVWVWRGFRPTSS